MWVVRGTFWSKCPPTPPPSDRSRAGEEHHSPPWESRNKCFDVLKGSNPPSSQGHGTFKEGPTSPSPCPPPWDSRRAGVCLGLVPLLAGPPQDKEARVSLLIPTELPPPPAVSFNMVFDSAPSTHTLLAPHCCLAVAPSAPLLLPACPHST